LLEVSETPWKILWWRGAKVFAPDEVVTRRVAAATAAPITRRVAGPGRRTAPAPAFAVVELTLNTTWGNR
jgi:hypothetical protein